MGCSVVIEPSLTQRPRPLRSAAPEVVLTIRGINPRRESCPAIAGLLFPDRV